MDDKMKNLENRIKEEMDLQFRRGMYMAAHGISGVINQMIEKLENKPKKGWWIIKKHFLIFLVYAAPN